MPYPTKNKIDYPNNPIHPVHPIHPINPIHPVHPINPINPIHPINPSLESYYPGVFMRALILSILVFIISISSTNSQTRDSIPIHLDWAAYYSGIVVSDIDFDSKDNVYFIADGPGVSYDRLVKFDPDSKLIWEINFEDRGLIALTIDPYDNIIVSSSEHIEKYSSDGELIWNFSYDNERIFNYLVSDSEGNIYARLEGKNRIMKIDKDGNFTWTQNLGLGILIIAVNSNDDLVVLRSDPKATLDYNYYILDKEDGSVLFRKNAIAGYIVRWIAVDKDDNIIFSGGDFNYDNSNWDNESTTKMDKDGNIIYNIIHPPMSIFDVDPVHEFQINSVDQYGNAYVALLTLTSKEDNHDVLIKKIDPSGMILWEYQFGVNESNINDYAYSTKFKPPNTLCIGGNTPGKLEKYYSPVNTDYQVPGHPAFLAKFTVERINFEIYDKDIEEQFDTLDLGKICLGDTKTGFAAVKNFSDFGLHLKPPVFEDNEHFSGGYMRGDSLFWNDTLGVRIHVAPDKTGPIETMMYIYCNEDDAIMDSLLIKALVVEPGMEISNDIDFGYVKFGKRPEKTFTIHNTGTSDLYISDLNEFDLPFRITETDPAIPAVLIPGDSMIVTMTVQGTAEKEYFDTLSVETQKIGEACPIDGFVKLHTITLRYELAANDIDYGFVADCKTPLDTVRLVNCGGAPVKLLDEAYLKNKDDFEIVSATPLGTVLDFLDTAFYVIRFTPQAPDGLKTGELRIKTDHPEEGFRTVRLRGETESVNLTAENISFGNVGINRNSTLKCVLTNHNGFELTISEIIENHDWLEIQPQSFTIPAGEDYEIEATINLADAIDYSAWPQIIIQGPCPDTVAFRIDATGIKSSVEVTPICNYNETEFCQSKTMDIEIKNTGKLPLTLLSGEIQGTDKELFSFEDSYENIEIQPGNSIIEKVIFTPESSTNGPKTAQARNIILIDMVEVEFITELQGERYTILYEIPESVSVSARISENATEQIEIKNTGEYDFTIEEISLENAAEFSIAPDLTGRKINTGNSEMLTVSLFSGIAGDYDDKIYLKFAGPFCEYRDTIDISGIVKHENLIFFPETIGTIGDPDFRIPLMVSLNSTEDISGLSYTAEISLDAYLYDLTGIDNATILSNEKSGRERILSISGENISLSKGEQAIAELSGGLLLSDIRECELKINSFEWDSPYIDNSTQNGFLKVEEICIGDLRAISTFAIPGITACPNPATGQIEINLSGDISNPQSLEIYDSQGKLLREHPLNSKDKIKINIQELSSGLYFLILKTATGIYYDKVVVE